jgi:DNA-binding transcriptional LysR family regulator
MADVNDYLYFAEVVAQGGFSAAGRRLGLPKSKLSRRVAELESRLGVRLLERSTRRLRLTDLGEAVYERCRALAVDVEQVEAAIAGTQGEPRGRVRVSCSTAFVPMVAGMLTGFLMRHPKVRVQVVGSDAPVDLIADRFDVALRASAGAVGDSALTVRTLSRSPRVMVAAPALAQAALAAGIDALAEQPTISAAEEGDEVTWQLFRAGGESRTVRHLPRFGCANFLALLEAAEAGLGISLLPHIFCAASIAAGRLVHLFPEWSAETGHLDLTFTTRRGLPAATRALIDHLAEEFRLVPG